jgi:hypothetical protein
MLPASFPAAVCRRAMILCTALFAVLITTGSLNKVQSQTRLLRTPSVTSTQIAFAYANNIWTVPRAGGSARRITSFQGQTGNPHFSPDGKWIAFSGEYAGNLDVYVVAADGGEPRRLTWHPGADQVQGWMPDVEKRFCFPRHGRHGRPVAHPVSGPCPQKVVLKSLCHCREVTRERSRPMGRESLIE